MIYIIFSVTGPSCFLNLGRYFTKLIFFYRLLYIVKKLKKKNIETFSNVCNFLLFHVRARSKLTRIRRARETAKSVGIDVFNAIGERHMGSPKSHSAVCRPSRDFSNENETKRAYLIDDGRRTVAAVAAAAATAVSLSLRGTPSADTVRQRT